MATPARIAAVVLGASLSFAAAAADLFNNTNVGGVANKPTIHGGDAEVAEWSPLPSCLPVRR
jgi:hypothetical protein